MKTVLNLKVMMMLAMISFFAMNLSAQKSAETAVVFNVKIDCRSCVKKIENHFGPMRGIKKLKVNMEAQTVSMSYSNARWDEAKLIAEFKKLDLDATPAKEESCTEVKKCCGGH